MANPYRITTQGTDLNELAPNNPARIKPEWVLEFNNALFYDPENPEVIEYVAITVYEIIKKYDVDGIHFDDYFYPYPVNGLEFSDDETYKKYGEGFFTKEEWRRNNVDTFISELNNAIKSKDSTLKFGVSPFGIWRNGESVGGSATSGLSSYDDVYVDSRKWIKEGYIDYIIPQIYWQFDNKNAPYSILVDWWAKQVEGTNVELYIGNAVYKINDSTYGDAWLNENEVINQIRYSRTISNVKGNCFFRLGSLEENRLGFTDELKEFYEKNQ